VLIDAGIFVLLVATFWYLLGRAFDGIPTKQLRLGRFGLAIVGIVSTMLFGAASLSVVPNLLSPFTWTARYPGLLWTEVPVLMGIIFWSAIAFGLAVRRYRRLRRTSHQHASSPT